MSDGGISYHWFNPRGEKHIIMNFVHCYGEVLKQDLGDCWKKCSICGETWSKKKQAYLDSIAYTHCRKQLEDVWSEDAFVSYVFSRLDPTIGATCWLAMDGPLVVGYSWGFSENLNALEERLDAPGLTRFIKRKFGDVEMVAFQDQIGVIEKYRKGGIASVLFSKRLEIFAEADLKVGVALLSSKTAHLILDWYKKRGYVAVYDFKDADENIIVACSLGSLKFQ